MRDPFGAQQHVHVAHQFSGEFTPVTMPSRTGYMLGNGDGESWAPTSSSWIRHQYPKMSGIRNARDEFNNYLLDPEIEELCSRSRSQEEEILLLHKQLSDASAEELQLLQEKHVLERRLSDLRMALDENQVDATSDALKELTQRKGYIEENMRLAHDLKVAEEEVYVFTSSLLSLLAEYNIRLPLLNSSSITNNTKRLHQHMDWKIRSSGMESSETWEETSLILKRSGYQVLVNSTRHAVIEEKFSPDIFIKVPNGQSTQFVLICSDGTTLPFSTRGACQAYNTADDIRLRDVIVLTMRYFRAKAVDGKRKGRA